MAEAPSNRQPGTWRRLRQIGLPFYRSQNRPGATAGKDWAARLAKAIADLNRLNTSTEHDFLAVGDKLIEFRAGMQKIAADSAELIGLFGGEEARRVAGTLGEVQSHAHLMDERVERSGQALADVNGLSANIRSEFSGLHNTVAVFRTLCTLTRIESSRLGRLDEQFGELAAEVVPLSLAIQESGAEVLAASARLNAEMQTAMGSAADARRRQMQGLAEMVADVEESLRSFGERQERAADSAARQAEQYRDLTAAVDDLVRSIQFHDITRQQIEHVAEALSLLNGEGVSRGRPAGTRSILRLQASQLSGAASTFAGSVANLGRDLSRIAARVNEMSEAGRSLMGISSDEQDSFFLGMEGHFTSILKLLDACQSEHSSMRATADKLAASVREMRSPVERIRGIEIRIQRIATNAAIRACHIGEAGKALDVIAGNMERLAMESNASTESVAGTLETMDSAAARMAEAGSEAGESGAGQVAAAMRHAVEDLHGSSERSFARVHELASLGARLASEAEELRGKLSVGSLMSRVAGAVLEELGRLAEESPGEESEADGAPSSRLETLSGRYTMQMERDVHAAAVNALTATAEDQPAGSLVGAEDELGGNVELF
jgi:hypothetical protein